MVEWNPRSLGKNQETPCPSWIENDKSHGCAIASMISGSGGSAAIIHSRRCTSRGDWHNCIHMRGVSIDRALSNFQATGGAPIPNSLRDQAKEALARASEKSTRRY